MKIRTDFVTNSSSTGFIAVRVDFKNGESVKLQESYDSGFGGYFWNGGDFRSGFERAKTGGDILSALESHTEAFELVSGARGYPELREALEKAGPVENIRSISLSEDTRFDEGKPRQYRLTYYFDSPSATFDGKRICLSGIRNATELKRRIEGLGGKVVPSVTKSVDYLITDPGSDGQTKPEKAKELIAGGANIQIISASQFELMLKAEENGTTLTYDRYGNAYVIDKNGVLLDCAFVSETAELPQTMRDLFPEISLDTENARALIIPGSIKKLRAGFLWNCPLLEYVIIKDGVEEAEKDCFGNCWGIKGMALPRSLTKISGGLLYTQYVKGMLFVVKGSEGQAYAEKMGYSYETVGEEVTFEEMRAAFEAKKAKEPKPDVEKTVQAFVPDEQIRARGREIYDGGKITYYNIGHQGGSIVVEANVRGSSGESYRTSVALNTEYSLTRCSCPAFRKSNKACKHVAAILYKFYTEK